MAETWVLNATITPPSSALSGAFTSNGNSYSGISGNNRQLYYRGSSIKSVYTVGSGWTHNEYRTLVFDTSPTGAMLTWLQANGVKQSDPEPETPTNSCLVDGTVYGIKTGQTLVNGMAQTIYNGRALVAGAGYDIVLSSSEFTVTIEGRGSTKTAWVVINGTTYTSTTTLTVESGTTIALHTEGENQATRQNTKITIDGVTVVHGTTSHAASYMYTPTGDITVTLSTKTTVDVVRYGIIDIITS